MTFPSAQVEWTWALDGWIVAVGVLCALSCALLGNFLVLRRMSMMADAISHAVLPGLAAAFLISDSREPYIMLAGAAVVGVLTALLTETIHKLGKVEQGASMGVVFTSLFALGLILMVRAAADHVDLDPKCVLYGAMEQVPLNLIDVWGARVPRAVVTLAVIFVVDALFVLAFYKELKVTSFDPALATTMGINSTFMHYALMTLVAATVVASFEAVGNILVVAMIIVPGACAFLLTERLGPMILVSLVIAALCGVLGHIAAITIPPMFGFSDTNTAGMMATVAGAIFMLVLLGAPKQGVISKLAHRALLSLRIVREDVLGALYRIEEGRGTSAGVPAAELRRAIPEGGLLARVAVWQLRRRGRVAAAPQGGFGLTPAGRDEATRILRSHRLWEGYLVDQMRVRVDHSHGSAERLEHVTSAEMQRRLDEELTRDTSPKGKPIPRPAEPAHPKP